MKKRFLIGFIIVLVLLGVSGMANATLVSIGTAEYDSDSNGTVETYNLIYDNDSFLTWLDYSNTSLLSWDEYNNWAAALNAGGVVTYNLNPDVTNWDAGDWRLSEMVDGESGSGFEGDPDGDGIFTYYRGYNLTNSEMGHLFYEELGNTGYKTLSGDTVPAGDRVQDPGPFENLLYQSGHDYWSGTERSSSAGTQAWTFEFYNGRQAPEDKTDSDHIGLAVRSGEVTFQSVPEPSIILLGITCLLGLGITGIRQNHKK